MHYWGDDWFKQYGDELNEAIRKINQGMCKIHVLCLGKEKYGALRTDFFSLWSGSWNEWKGQYNNHPWYDKTLSKINHTIGITWIIHKWQIKKINQYTHERNTFFPIKPRPEGFAAPPRQ